MRNICIHIIMPIIQINILNITKLVFPLGSFSYIKESIVHFHKFIYPLIKMGNKCIAINNNNISCHKNNKELQYFYNIRSTSSKVSLRLIP